MKKIRYGICSTASIVGRFIQGIHNSEYGEVVAISSRSIHKAQQAARQYKIDKAYGDYKEMLQDPDVDVVYIATPNANHYQDALLAILANKHVVLEKPFVLTKQQAQQLFIEAQNHRVFLMEAQKIVFLPITNHLKKLIQEKALGDLHYVNMTSSFPNRFDYDHWMYSLQYGGGALYGSTAYTTEYLMHLLNVLTMEYQAVQVKAPTGVDEFCQLQMVIDHQVVVSSCISMNVATKNVATFYFDEGYIEIENYWKARKMKIVQDGTEKIIEYPCECEFVYEVNHVNECIQQGLLTSPMMTKEMTIQTMDMVESIFRSWNPEVIREKECI